MKRIIATALFALAVLVVVDSAMAQNYRVKVNIPFNFIAGSTTLPAGTYTISSDDNFALVIQGGKEHATVLSSLPLDDNQSEKVRLIFNVYGEQHFLHEILCPNANLDLALPLSNAEKNTRIQEQGLSRNDQSGIWLNK
jgi:hypothetical protein